MVKCSSKYLNLEALGQITDINPSSDAVILLTNFGYIIGELDFDGSDDNLSVANLIMKTKSKICDSEDIEAFNDGSLICVKNVTVKYANNLTISFNELTVHCDDIVGFSPINKADFLNQL